jgi:hypothetical protein
VSDYQTQFLAKLTRFDGVTERQQVDIFTAGLRSQLHIDVELQDPTTLEEAMALARAAFERRMELDEEHTRTPTCSRQATPPRATPTRAATQAPPTPTARVKAPPPTDTRFTHLSPTEIAERRRQGLCFNYPEKFSREHLKVCPMKGIYFLVLDSKTAIDDDF